MKTIVVEKDGYVEMDSASFSFMGSKKVRPGKLWQFSADHWHEDPEGQYSGERLDIIDETVEVVATFKPGYWNRVYVAEALADYGGN